MSCIWAPKLLVPHAKLLLLLNACVWGCLASLFGMSTHCPQWTSFTLVVACYADQLCTALCWPSRAKPRPSAPCKCNRAEPTNQSEPGHLRAPDCVYVELVIVPPHASKSTNMPMLCYKVFHEACDNRSNWQARFQQARYSCRQAFEGRSQMQASSCFALRRALQSTMLPAAAARHNLMISELQLIH